LQGTHALAYFALLLVVNKKRRLPLTPDFLGRVPAKPSETRYNEFGHHFDAERCNQQPQLSPDVNVIKTFFVTYSAAAKASLYSLAKSSRQV
jgi:hypothetical protein